MHLLGNCNVNQLWFLSFQHLHCDSKNWHNIIIPYNFSHIDARVRHGYTAGRIFAHRTREHRTRTATGTVSAGNGYGFLRNPRFFSTIKNYCLLEKIIIIYYCAEQQQLVLAK